MNIKKPYHLAKSILGLKCPKCSEGNLFNKKGLFRYNQMLSMPEKCSNCGKKFELEPGFWVGSLWTSYPIIVVLELPFLIYGLLQKDANFAYIFCGMIITMLVFTPLIFRLGRSIWIHITIPKKHKN